MDPPMATWIAIRVTRTYILPSFPRAPNTTSSATFMKKDRKEMHGGTTFLNVSYFERLRRMIGYDA